MNTYIKIIASISLMGSTFACNQDIEEYKNEQTFIYFDTPYKLNEYGRPTTTRVDSIEYSFAMENSDYKMHTINIPVNTVSLYADIDRGYKVEIVQDSTTATSDDWDVTSIQNTNIKAGNNVDTIRLKIKRSAIMESESRTIYLKLVPNDNFELGIPNLTTVKIVVSDILLAPAYWSKIPKYVGTVYYKEVYRKWIELYYLGADPNLEHIAYAPNVGKPLWYGNMPHLITSISSSYPSTHMFFGKLKRYFDEHDIYPNGDATKAPIRLPRV